jgi:hypothetical protein
MKKLMFFLLFASSIALFWGCPFESEYELEGAMMDSVDTRLLGRWMNSTDSTNMFILVDRYEEPEYREWVNVTVLPKADALKSEALDETYDCRFARVGNYSYIIMVYYDEEFSDHLEHYYYNYRVVDKNTIILKDVSASYETDTITSDAALKTYFEKNQTKSDFLISEKKYKRIL